MESEKTFFSLSLRDFRPKVKIVIKSENSMQKAYTFLEYARVFAPHKDSEVIWDEAIKRMQESHAVCEGHIGWVIDKDLPTKRDAAWLLPTVGANIGIIRRAVMEELVKYRIPGVYFQPIWVKNITEISECNYFSYTTTNVVNTSFKLNILTNRVEIPSSIYSTLLPINRTGRHADGNPTTWVVPDIVNFTIYNVLCKFRGFSFKEIDFV